MTYKQNREEIKKLFITALATRSIVSNASSVINSYTDRYTNDLSK